MSCIITYKGKQYSEEKFKEYFINNKNEFATSIIKNKDVIDSFKRKMEGIDYVFSQSPELASIGSKAQYLQYLSTIFKTSKVKDIVYHGTDTRFENFDKTKIGSKESTAHAKGFYFGWAGSHGAANVYAGNFGRGKKVMLSNLVKVQNSFRIYGSFAPIKNNPEFVDFLIRNGFDITKWQHYPNGDIFDYTTKIGTAKITEAFKKEGYDSVIVDKGGWKTIKRNKELGDVESNSNELIIFEPEQIHILSSKKDLEMFKNFINFTKSEYAKYGDIQQFRDYIISKNFATVEEFLVINNKIDRKC